MIITGDNPHLISQLKAHLHATFSIKDLGPLNFFFGIEASYCDKGIILTQFKFSHELLRDAAFTDIKPHVTPLPLNFKMSSHESPFLPILPFTVASWGSSISSPILALISLIQFNLLANICKNPENVIFKLSSTPWDIFLILLVKVFCSQPLTLLLSRLTLILIGLPAPILEGPYPILFFSLISLL